MARIFTPRNATAAVVGLGLLASGAATATAAGKSAPVKSHKITAAESQQVKDAVAVALPGFTAKKVSRDAKGGFTLEGKVRKSYADGSFRLNLIDGTTVKELAVSADFSTVTERPADDDDAAAPTPEVPATS